MDELIPATVVSLLAVMALAVWQRTRFTRQEQLWVMGSLVLHIVSAIVIWTVDERAGGSDMTGYALHGRELARALYADFPRFAPELVKYFLQRSDAFVPGIESIADSSTGSMCAISGAVMFVTNESVYAAAITVACIAFSGKVAMYRVFRESFPESYRLRLLFAFLLVPSVVCWSSGLIKEAVAIAGLGWIVLGVHRFLQGRRAIGLVAAVCGGVLVAMIKGYVLVALSVAVVVWVYLHRAAKSSHGRGPAIRPAFLVIALVAAWALVVGLGALFPKYSIDSFGEQSARYQELSMQAEGGSNIEIGDYTERSLGGQLAYAPAALVAALFRPFIFEVRNALMAMAALETSVLLYIVLRIIFTRDGRAAFARAWRTPLLAFSLAFTLLFGVAVGLVTGNLGTLSRYRLPMMPFYVAFIVIVTKRRDEEDEVLASFSLGSETVSEGDGGIIAYEGGDTS